MAGFKTTLECKPAISRKFRYDGEFLTHFTAFACSKFPMPALIERCIYLRIKSLSFNMQIKYHIKKSKGLKKENLSLGKSRIG